MKIPTDLLEILNHLVTTIRIVGEELVGEDIALVAVMFGIYIVFLALLSLQAELALIFVGSLTIIFIIFTITTEGEH